MLSVKGLHVSYGNIVALRGVSLELAKGEIVAVIGPNGAGKSTLLLTIAGVVRAKQGEVRLGDAAILGIARAIAMKPRFLLMDEPAAGLNDAECDDLIAVIDGIRSQGDCGVLLIEHRMSLVFRLCDRIQVLQQGATIAIGTPDQIRANPKVRQAYLGDEAV